MKSMSILGYNVNWNEDQMDGDMYRGHKCAERTTLGLDPLGFVLDRIRED